MEFRLFVFDLDGTLLGPGGEVSSATQEFLRWLRKRALVTLATGRALASAWPYIEAFGIQEPVILYHGAVVFCPRSRRPLREVHLSSEVTRSALAIAERFPVDIQVYRSIWDSHVYVRSFSPAIFEFVRKENLGIRVIDNLEALIVEGQIKILFIGNMNVLDELAIALKNKKITVIRSERNYLEVLPPQTSKGMGLVWLCRRLGIPLEQVVAVGDQESDVSMFKCAGLGVAMAHAPRQVVREADWVVRQVAELERLFR
ncbi:MAG: HAD-IIB family hydrolase [Candidatus Bipolaricaulaceae bacterium]